MVSTSLPASLSSSPFLPHFTTSFPPINLPPPCNTCGLWVKAQDSLHAPPVPACLLQGAFHLPGNPPPPHPNLGLSGFIPFVFSVPGMVSAWHRYLVYILNRRFYSTPQQMGISRKCGLWKQIWVRTAGSRWTAQPGNLRSPSLDFLICKMWLLRRCNELCVTDSACMQLAWSIFSCPHPFIVPFFLKFFKIFVEFVTALLLFCVLGHDSCVIIAPGPGGQTPIIPSIGRQSLNHWTAREVPPPKSLFSFVSITLLRLQVSLYFETQDLR